MAGETGGAVFRVGVSLRAAMLARQALSLVGVGSTPAIVEACMADVIRQATEIIDVARQEAAKA